MLQLLVPYFILSVRSIGFYLDLFYRIYRILLGTLLLVYLFLSHILQFEAYSNLILLLIFLVYVRVLFLCQS